MKAIETTWNGIKYPSTKEASQSSTYSHATFHLYRKRGAASDTDIARMQAELYPRRKVPVTINGIPFLSQAEAARHFKLSRARIHQLVGERGEVFDHTPD